MARCLCVLALALIVPGCAIPGAPAFPPASPPAPPDRPTGAPPREISASEARIALLDGAGAARTRQARIEAGRYEEVLGLDGGFLRYAVAPPGRTLAERADNRAAIAAALQDVWYRNQGMPAAPRELRRGENAYGRFDYVVLDGDIARCFLFSQFLGVRTNGLAERHLRGGRCFRHKDLRGQLLESQSLALVGRIRLADLPAPRPGQTPR